MQYFTSVGNYRNNVCIPKMFSRLRNIIQSNNQHIIQIKEHFLFCSITNYGQHQVIKKNTDINDVSTSKLMLRGFHHWRMKCTIIW